MDQKRNVPRYEKQPLAVDFDLAEVMKTLSNLPSEIQGTIFSALIRYQESLNSRRSTSAKSRPHLLVDKLIEELSKTHDKRKSI